ncbi:hypothetical protein [Catellatospora vulcania]|uniref:hypothetical protein n=1 Tax=Catellatospora vulcania TaxID=1460450 RepID=UPI0012D44883|nr:hypothetical protein [Catellatospora vulcania]
MRRLLLVVFGVLGVLLLAVPAGACAPCVPLTDAEKLQRADLVVVGVVSDLDSIFSESATVRVAEVVKGQAGKEISLADPRGNPCLSPLNEGHRYRLYLVRSGDGWARMACAAAERQSTEPVLAWWRIHDEWVTTAAVATGAVFLVLAAARIRRRRASA